MSRLGEENAFFFAGFLSILVINSHMALISVVVAAGAIKKDFPLASNAETSWRIRRIFTVQGVLPEVRILFSSFSHVC